jgi:hypothetical protein
MATTDQMTAWWADHTELARLYRFLCETGMLEGEDESATVENTADFLEKPWKWQEERGWMLAGKIPDRPALDDDDFESEEESGAGR